MSVACGVALACLLVLMRCNIMIVGIGDGVATDDGNDDAINRRSFLSSCNPDFIPFRRSIFMAI